MPAPYPTLTISQLLSPAESRGLWLSLYAAAFARGLPILESLDVATRGVIALSASVLANDPALPPWLKTYDDEAEEVPHAVAPESASARAEGSPRERAIEALHRDVLSMDQHGCERNCAEVAVDAIEGAGLRIVDAAEHERSEPLTRGEKSTVLSLLDATAIGLDAGTVTLDDGSDATPEGLRAISEKLRAAWRLRRRADYAERLASQQDYAQRAAETGGKHPDGDHASIDSADDGRAHGRDTSRESVTAASSPRAPGDASPAREGSTDRCPAVITDEDAARAAGCGTEADPNLFFLSTLPLGATFPIRCNARSGHSGSHRTVIGSRPDASIAVVWPQSAPGPDTTDRCPECCTNKGAHKLDCSRGRRDRHTGPAKGLKCPECRGEGRVFSIDASSYDDRDCSRCRGTGKG